MKPYWKIRIVTTHVLQVRTLEKRHQLKIIQALLVVDRVSVHLFLTSPNVPLTKSVHELLVAYPVNDPIWDCTDSCDILIDTVNSAKVMAGSHIIEPECIFHRSNPAFEDTELFVDVASDTIQEDRIYKFMDNYDKWDNPPNTAVVGIDTGSSHTFTVVNASGSVNESIKSNFWICKRQS